jgi:hypothetical protein
MSEIMLGDEERLEREYRWAKETYPKVDLERSMVSGLFLEELQTIAAEEEASVIVMGASGNYADLLSWDRNIIDAFVDFQIPVLIVPSQAQYRPVQKIGFACNYYRKNLETPITKIKRLVQFTGANLFVIHVGQPSETLDEEAKKNKQLLQENLADVKPVYYEPSYANVISTIDKFTENEKIDLLIVIPSRHGIWQNIFEKQYTKGLVYLNRIPVLSLYREGVFI